MPAKSSDKQTAHWAVPPSRNPDTKRCWLAAWVAHPCFRFLFFSETARAVNKSPFLSQQLCCSNISPCWAWNFNGCWRRQHLQLPIDAAAVKWFNGEIGQAVLFFFFFFSWQIQFGITGHDPLYVNVSRRCIPVSPSDCWDWFQYSLWPFWGNTDWDWEKMDELTVDNWLHQSSKCSLIRFPFFIITA